MGRIIPYTLLTLGAVFGFVVCWALDQMWRFTIGYIFKKFSEVGIPTGFFGSIHPFSFLEGINNSVHDYLSKQAASFEHAMVTLFGQWVKMLLALGREIGSLAETVEQRLVGLVRGTIPGLIRGAVGALWSQVKRIPALVKRVEHLIGSVAAIVARTARKVLAFELKQLQRFGKSLLHTAAGIFKNIKSIFKLVRRLEKYVFGKGFPGLVNGALKKLKLGWLFAVNVERFAQWLTLHGAEEVYEFTKDALTVLSETDMCKLAAYQYDVAVYVFEPFMQELIGLGDWFCFHSGDSLPSATKGTAGYTAAWAPSATPAITGPFTPQRLAPDVPLPRGVVKA